VLKNLCYLLKLRTVDGKPQRPAWNALQQSLELALRIVLSQLYIPVELDISCEVTVPTVEEAMKNVKLSMEAWIDHEIDTSSRTKDLLTGRVSGNEFQTDKLVKKSLAFRHYLRITSTNHRGSPYKNDFI
jgi:hypothetical protein